MVQFELKARWCLVLKKGQIKFTKKAAEIAKQYFIKKKVTEFLVVLGEAERAKRKQEKANERKRTGNQKANPSKAKEFYSLLLGAKQTSKSKVYTIDIPKAKKLFEVSLIKEGRLSFIFSPTSNCILYISQGQQSKYDSIKLPENKWPAVFLNENNKNSVAEFERKMNKNSAVDLIDLI